MALSTLPQPTEQEEQATAEAPGPGGRTPRERFDALPQELRDKILDAHRNWNVEHIDWWDGVYDCFKSDMEAIGIEVDRMYFSGFWSQGDGACFEGCVRDWAKFLASLGHTDAALIEHAAAQFRFSVRHSGHYYHEHCTSFSSGMPMLEYAADQDFIDGYCPYESDSLHEAVWAANMGKYLNVDLEDQFTESFKDHMRKLYAQLEEEYDYLTSDEAVLESLDTNDQLEDLINDAITEEEDA